MPETDGRMLPATVRHQPRVARHGSRRGSGNSSSRSQSSSHQPAAPWPIKSSCGTDPEVNAAIELPVSKGPERRYVLRCGFIREACERGEEPGVSHARKTFCTGHTRHVQIPQPKQDAATDPTVRTANCIPLITWPGVSRLERDYASDDLLISTNLSADCPLPRCIDLPQLAQEI